VNEENIKKAIELLEKAKGEYYKERCVTLDALIALLNAEQEEGCSHDWVNRTDGYEEQCGAAICTICGEYGCWCRAKWSEMTDEQKKDFEARGITGNNHELRDKLKSEQCPESQEPEKLKKFNCKHFIDSSQQVPMPFGSGTCSEPLGDCVIESESEDCTIDCPDYQEPCNVVHNALKDIPLKIHSIGKSDRLAEPEKPEQSELSVYDGKYTFYMKNHSLHCLRYGEEWRDFIGDGAVLQLFLYARDLTEQWIRLSQGCSNDY
jgi:hypothetical protein